MLRKNEMYGNGEEVIRVLEIKEDGCLVIDCVKETMPVWKAMEALNGYSEIEENALYSVKGFEPVEEDKIPPERKRIMHERFTLIAPVLAVLGDDALRSHIIDAIAEKGTVSKQTIRQYLKRYLVLQHIQALLPKERINGKELTEDQKNMRWGLNKYFYTFEKNSLHTAYVKMLQARYCDETGKLKDAYPTFHQFRYFYRKTRKMENFYISRNGLTNYQRNDRPCLGDNVRVYASAPGLGMVDATVCDIYLVNESGKVVGRPILTSCIDAYSGICMGYALSWEGGIYSVRDLMLNIIEDKQKYCMRYGIRIETSDWPVKSLPGRIMSDHGNEYVGRNLEQITELGITLENLPAYRPDLKGPVEKFFDVIQNIFKRDLKGRGVIGDDFLERGGQDYRKDACLTLEAFNKIILRCILHYNSSHVMEDYPYTEDMLKNETKPYSNSIWNFGIRLPGTNLISVSKEKLTLCLLPRTTGSYSRYGLRVNNLYYKNDGYKEMFLSGGKALVAYDTDNASYIWVIEQGKYIRFTLTQSRFKDKTIADAQDIIKRSRAIVKTESEKRLQAEIDISGFIRNVVETEAVKSDNDIKTIRETRKEETIRKHRNHTREAGLYD